MHTFRKANREPEKLAKITTQATIEVQSFPCAPAEVEDAYLDDLRSYEECLPMGCSLFMLSWGLDLLFSPRKRVQAKIGIVGGSSICR
ncbi:hypothetical protein V6N13_130628 [Hibiscus sabdariffa]|uniref:Uncharacterized protein n=2 Tax=Hibiscus sabdariffa TaxID=183260 RepID=A0ABR2P086_9ROSI